jgi:endonuclease/exonuclease/phosphatase family metal-dependent hydrolase
VTRSDRLPVKPCVVMGDFNALLGSNETARPSSSSSLSRFEDEERYAEDEDDHDRAIREGSHYAPRTTRTSTFCPVGSTGMSVPAIRFPLT